MQLHRKLNYVLFHLNSLHKIIIGGTMNVLNHT
jgi:hypothetical protein